MKTRPKGQTSSQKRKGPAQAIPEAAVSLFLVILIWLFAELIFLPLSAESFPKDLGGRITSIVAAAFILAIGCLLPNTAHKGAIAVKLLSNLLSKSRYPKSKQAAMTRVFESLGRAFLSAILGIVVSSLLYWIHPVFGGMTLLAAIIIVAIFLFQGAS